MKIYADRPGRLLLQLTADLSALAWIAVWMWAAFALHDTLSALARPGRLMAGVGDDVDHHMDEAAERVRQVPVAGDGLAEPFAGVGEAGTSLGDAGRSLQEGVADAALFLAVVTALLPVALILAVWLPVRVRWVRAAARARRSGSLEARARTRLLALRALSSVSPERLARVHGDPAGAWRADDTAAIEGLAALELRRLGLREEPR